jgi:[acyl-carrier-protein] S-malonyltransferase
MGRELAAQFEPARQVFEAANTILGFDITKIMWEGPELDLNDTLNTQPALFIHSLAAFRAFQSLDFAFAPVTVAGHSLGELSAICAAGAISFEDGLRLVRKRGELMKRAGEQNPGGMAAILGLDIPSLEKVCAEASVDGELVQVANDNSPGQVVISGHKPALERAMTGAKAAGAKRALPLAVSIAAHSPLMDSIQAEWNEAVAQTTFSDVIVPVVGNVHAAAITSAADLRADVIAQMQSRVRWVDSVRNMSASGIKAYVEVGNGTVLGGLIKRIDAQAETYPLGNPKDFEI